VAGPSANTSSWSLTVQTCLGDPVPPLNGSRIEGVRASGQAVRIEASTLDEPVACPGCGTPSCRVHSRYQRRLSDTAVVGREMQPHSRLGGPRPEHSPLPGPELLLDVRWPGVRLGRGVV
jgi:hypothetical protein